MASRRDRVIKARRPLAMCRSFNAGKKRPEPTRNNSALDAVAPTFRVRFMNSPQTHLLNGSLKRTTVALIVLCAAIVWVGSGAFTLRGAGDAKTIGGTTAAVPSDALTDETLMKMLQDMGLEPKKLSKGFLVMISQDSWKLYAQLVLSSDGSKLGLNANLGMIADDAAVTADQWKQLMIANGDIDPSCFYYDKDQKKLYLHRSFDNRTLTAAIIRKQLDSFCSNIRSTEALWKFTK